MFAGCHHSGMTLVHVIVSSFIIIIVVVGFVSTYKDYQQTTMLKVLGSVKNFSE